MHRQYTVATKATAGLDRPCSSSHCWHHRCCRHQVLFLSSSHTDKTLHPHHPTLRVLTSLALSTSSKPLLSHFPTGRGQGTNPACYVSISKYYIGRTLVHPSKNPSLNYVQHLVQFNFLCLYILHSVEKRKWYGKISMMLILTIIQKQRG